MPIMGRSEKSFSLEIDMKTVSIMMSTFNGEQFIDEQIESIMHQDNVITMLIIRDDGSTDDTVKCVNRLMTKYQGRISLICGNNIGYRRSFLELLSKAPDTDYYAFADQDDVWKNNKCIEAITSLEKCDHNEWLYASGLLIADENLNVISENYLNNYKNSLESYFIRGRLAGCTFLFTRELKDKAKLFSELNLEDTCMPAHDFLVGSIAYACGNVFIDHRGFVLHRRHERSVTSGGRGIANRLETERKLLKKRKYVNSVVARLLLDNFGELISADKASFLNTIVHYQDGSRSKLRLLLYPGFSSGSLLGDLLTRIKIFINNY